MRKKQQTQKCKNNDWSTLLISWDDWWVIPAEKCLKSGFTDETDRRRDACRPIYERREQRREPSRAARNVNWGRASWAARRGIAGRRLVTPALTDDFFYFMYISVSPFWNVQLSFKFCIFSFDLIYLLCLYVIFIQTEINAYLSTRCLRNRAPYNNKQATSTYCLLIVVWCTTFATPSTCRPIYSFVCCWK